MQRLNRRFILVVVTGPHLRLVHTTLSSSQPRACDQFFGSSLTCISPRPPLSRFVTILRDALLGANTQVGRFSSVAKTKWVQLPTRRYSEGTLRRIAIGFARDSSRGALGQYHGESLLVPNVLASGDSRFYSLLQAEQSPTMSFLKFDDDGWQYGHADHRTPLVTSESCRVGQLL